MSKIREDAIKKFNGSNHIVVLNDLKSHIETLRLTILHLIRENARLERELKKL